MISLTKEWLQQTIAELEEERDATPGAVNEDAANALAAMKLALASLEAEPVGEVVLGEYDDCGCRPDAKVVCIAADGQADWENFKDGTRLYIAPPAPVSVPEPIKRNDADGWWVYKGRRVGGGCAEWYNRALDDCRAAMLQGADGKPELTVWYGAMPETNGKTNWTAMLHRKGHHPWEGITIDRSEYPGRVRYEADRMRHLIGELADEPDILAYDSDAHSGYVEPVTTAYKLPEGWVAVPVEPTEDMIVNGFESEPDESFSDEKEWEEYDAMNGCQQAAHRAKLCWAAMIATAPKV
ncbi:hypothetical protein [Enterobacter hormaechei]|uniref:hypothetical protein n=1 Tax=Enterobacter hormaechei TaxID=158836 RepID=UPI00265B83E6|nr:hypothetical protein [Enterobacter hormaechei]MDO0900638.1 hypothetical protein [Enterobacter hormaechei]